jgi:hypothetical protein
MLEPPLCFLQSSGLPFRSDEKITDLLSAVQSNGASLVLLRVKSLWFAVLPVPSLPQPCA